MLLLRARFSVNSTNSNKMQPQRTSVFAAQIKKEGTKKVFSQSFVSLKGSQPFYLIFLDFPHDEKFNVSQNVAEKIGQNIYLKKGHPLNTIKQKMENYWKSAKDTKFNTFDNIPPFASVERNFDRLLFPSDHVGRSQTDTYYVNKSTVLRTHTTYEFFLINSR
jgi:phenylalanyl-tRNA synthetase alpha chain